MLNRRSVTFLGYHLWVQIPDGIPIISVILHPRALICFLKPLNSSIGLSSSMIDTITGKVSFSLRKAYFKCMGSGFNSMVRGSITDGLKGEFVGTLDPNLASFCCKNKPPSLPMRSLNSLTYVLEWFYNTACNGTSTSSSSRFHSSLSIKLSIWEITFKSRGCLIDLLTSRLNFSPFITNLSSYLFKFRRACLAARNRRPKMISITISVPMFTTTK